MVLRLESSGAQPAMISSSYTSESQAWHKEQLESRICGREDAPPGSGARAPSTVPSPSLTEGKAGSLHACVQARLRGRGSPHFQGRRLRGPGGVTEAL